MPSNSGILKPRHEVADRFSVAHKKLLQALGLSVFLMERTFQREQRICQFFRLRLPAHPVVCCREHHVKAPQMPSRLSTIAPQIELLLSEVPAEKREGATRRTAIKVVSLVPGFKPHEMVRLQVGSAAYAQAVASKLDERYFNLQAQESPESVKVFAQARAAAAMHFAVGGQVSEALYEAVIAVDSAVLVEGILRGELDGSL